MTYRLILLDLDGTLTNSDKLISPRTFSALMEAQARGLRICLASGRPPEGIMPLARQLRLDEYDGFVAAFNGGRVISCKTGRTVVDNILPEAAFPEICRLAEKHGLDVVTYQGSDIVTTSATSPYAIEEARINKMPLLDWPDFRERVRQPLPKCLIIGHPADIERFRLAEKEQLDRLQTDGIFETYTSAPFFLECMPIGVDKGRQMLRLLAELGLTAEEAIACGDGENDRTMIEMAGLGVAMANAVPSVLAAADFITDDNDSDGIARIIEQFVLK